MQKQRDAYVQICVRVSVREVHGKVEKTEREREERRGQEGRKRREKEEDKTDVNSPSWKNTTSLYLLTQSTYAFPPRLFSLLRLLSPFHLRLSLPSYLSFLLLFLFFLSLSFSFFFLFVSHPSVCCARVWKSAGVS